MITALLADGPVLLDGAWGTELQKRGLAPGSPPDAWNLLHPEKVADVARAYVEAGSRIILTNTFGTEDRATILAGVEIALRAAEGKALVFGSIGPGRGYGVKAMALAGAGAQGLAIETITNLAEGRAAAARETGLPVVASVAFVGKISPEEAAAALTEADAIGTNCVAPADAAEICRRLRTATSRPLWVKPNAGLPRWVEGRAVYDVTPEEFASFAPAWIEAGAGFVGGCCGAGPDFVRGIGDRMRAGSY